MNVSDRICTYQIIPIRGNRSWWSCQVETQSLTKSTHSYRNVNMWSYLNGRSDRDTCNWQIVNRSHPRATIRIRTYRLVSKPDSSEKTHDQLQKAIRGLRNGLHVSWNLALTNVQWIERIPSTRLHPDGALSNSGLHVSCVFFLTPKMSLRLKMMFVRHDIQTTRTPVFVHQTNWPLWRGWKKPNDHAEPTKVER